MDVHRHARRQGIETGHRGGDPQRELRRRKADAALPSAVHRKERPRCARMHPGHPPDQGRHRNRRDRHRQTPDGLRIPCADGQFPGGRHDHGRADGVGIEGRTRPLHRGDDGDSRGDTEDRTRGLAGRQQPAEERPAYPGGHHGRMESPVWPRGSRIPAAMGGGQQVLAERQPDRRCVWRP